MTRTQGVAVQWQTNRSELWRTMITLPTRQGSMLELLQELKQIGYSNSFEFRKGVFRCIESEKEYAPTTLSTEAIYRFEGDSNPSDMSVVYVLRASDGTGGVFVDAFGPNGDMKAAEFLNRVPDHREESDLQATVPSPKKVEVAVTESR